MDSYFIIFGILYPFWRQIPPSEKTKSILKEIFKMRNGRMTSRLLALALTILMLASCFVALPAMAEGEATSIS